MNSVFTLKRGAMETISFTLSDEDGPVDLTGLTVSILARATGGAALVLEETCDIDADQVANTGKGTYTFDGATSMIAAGTYNLEFKAISGLSPIGPYYFPSDRDEPYGRLYVINSLE